MIVFVMLFYHFPSCLHIHSKRSNPWKRIRKVRRCSIHIFLFSSTKFKLFLLSSAKSPENHFAKYKFLYKVPIIILNNYFGFLACFRIFYIVHLYCFIFSFHFHISILGHHKNSTQMIHPKVTFNWSESLFGEMFRQKMLLPFPIMFFIFLQVSYASCKYFSLKASCHDAFW